MAKKSYIGVGNVAHNVKKMYIGVDGVARKVKKAYIGVNGVARLCWSGETIYTWEKWDVNTSQKISVSVGPSRIDGTNQGDTTPITTSVLCYSDLAISNNQIVGSGTTSYQPVNNTGDRYFQYHGKWYYQGVGSIETSREDPDYRAYQIRAKSCSISTTTSKGSNYLGIVQSSSPFAYPTNGVRAGYWYVKK